MSAPLLIDEPPLQVLPSLATAIGLNKAIIVQQLHYCLRLPPPRVYMREGRAWVRNTYANWRKYHFPFWDETTIKRIFLALESEGYVLSRQFDIGRGAGDKFYSIDYKALREIRAKEGPRGESLSWAEQKGPEVGAKRPAQYEGHETTTQKEEEGLAGPADSFDEFNPAEDLASEFPMRQLIADICRWGPIDQIINFKREQALIQGERNLLKIGATLESLSSWAVWWSTIDWRGAKGELPAGPGTIYDTWHQFLEWKRPAPAPAAEAPADPECERCHGDRFYLSDPNDLDSQLIRCNCSGSSAMEARARSRA